MMEFKFSKSHILHVGSDSFPVQFIQVLAYTCTVCFQEPIRLDRSTQRTDDRMDRTDGHGDDRIDAHDTVTSDSE